jgi:hypothetical protein
MRRRFLVLGVGAFALLTVLGTPDRVHAQHMRGGFHGGVMPGFNSGFFVAPRFDPRFNSGFFDPRFNSGFFVAPRFDPRFNNGFFDPRFNPAFRPVFVRPF